MIKLMIINSEQFNGLDWNISKTLRGKSISVPQENITYKTIQRDYSLRFSNVQTPNVGLGVRLSRERV